MKKKIFTFFLALVASVGTLFAESGYCGEFVTWDLTNGVLTISGTGAMSDFSSDLNVPWRSNLGSIKSVTISDGVTSIGKLAFYKCSNLTSVTIPNSVTSIGYCAFMNCTKLNNVTIPNSVTSIGDGAFQSCTSLTSLTIPNSVTRIGSDALQSCSSLTSLTIPNSVVSFGSLNLWRCSALTSIVVEDGNPVYDSRDNCNAIIKTASNTLMEGCQNSIIPNGVTKIANNAFWDCTGLTSIEIPNSVTSIGEYAFSGCSDLTSVTIGNSVSSIGNRAFQACIGLTSLTLPNSLTSIDEVAFYNCRSLMSITCEAVTPPTCSTNEVFYGVVKSIPLYVPAESVETYRAADVWKDFTNILPIATGVEFTITWQDEDGNPIKVDEVAYGEIPVFSGVTPTKEATAEYTYEFAGWLPKISAVTKDISYTTFFERNKIETPKYTVNINAENCSLRISNELPAGTKLQVEAIADECFQFEKWSDNNTDNPRTITVTEDSNLTAEFNKVTYTITGENENEGGEVQIIP